MPTYVLLMKLTESGARDAKNIPQRIDEGIKAWEAMGGKVKTFLVTMGPWDYVAIGEGPSDEAAAAMALGLGKTGRVSTLSMKAFSRDEIAKILEGIPA